MAPQISPGFSRRKFIALSALAPAGVALAGSLAHAASTVSPRAAGMPRGEKKPRVGLELYSVRKELMRDLPGTLRAVSGMGYELVEFYAPYRQWTFSYAKDVRALMEDLGLRCLSTHNNLDSLKPGVGMSKAIELNQILGSRYIVAASSPKDLRTVAGWKQLCDIFSAAVSELEPHGLAAGFHNHAGEWAPVEGGQRALEIIAANTPKEFLLQLDVGTTMAAGMDPVAWIKAHPGRIRSIHLKDWAPGELKDEKAYRVLFAEGVSPWREIIAAAESVGGVEFYLIEQEGSRFSELETAQRCLATWKRLRATS